MRRAEVAEAVALLSEGAARAESACDEESRVIALVLLSATLAHAGRFAEAEQRAEEAIALCRKEEPDVILMDISMPKMDGITAAEKILQERLFHHPKIEMIWDSAIDEVLGAAVPLAGGCAGNPTYSRGRQFHGDAAGVEIVQAA